MGRKRETSPSPRRGRRIASMTATTQGRWPALSDRDGGRAPGQRRARTDGTTAGPPRSLRCRSFSSFLTGSPLSLRPLGTGNIALVYPRAIAPPSSRWHPIDPDATPRVVVATVVIDSAYRRSARSPRRRPLRPTGLSRSLREGTLGVTARPAYRRTPTVSLGLLLILPTDVRPETHPIVGVVNALVTCLTGGSSGQRTRYPGRPTS